MDNAVALVRAYLNADAAPELAHRLARGGAEMPNDHRARLVVFAGKADEGECRGDSFIALGHVFRFLQEYLEEHGARAGERPRARDPHHASQSATRPLQFGRLVEFQHQNHTYPPF